MSLTALRLQAAGFAVAAKAQGAHVHRHAVNAKSARSLARRDSSTAAKRISLESCTYEDRRVAYATAGDLEEGTPVLFFYPAGGNRRMLRILRKNLGPESPGLICINRPGKFGTTAAESNSAAAHADAACRDALAVLDHLKLGRVSLAYMCCGTPFAILFQARHPERTTGRMAGIATFVSPADFSGSKLLYKFATLWPPSLVGMVTGPSFAAPPTSLRSLPEAAQVMRYVSRETGGEAQDLAVLFSSLRKLGVDYSTLGATLTLVHGDADSVAQYQGAEWLAREVPGTELVRVAGAGHTGLLTLGPEEARQAVRGLQV